MASILKEKRMVQATGIEASFISSWEEWDDLGGDALYFYNVKLKPDVFPLTVKDGVDYDLAVDTQNSMIAVYTPSEQDEPVFTSKFKAVLI